jgi:hypothetical protein
VYTFYKLKILLYLRLLAEINLAGAESRNPFISAEMPKCRNAEIAEIAEIAEMPKF